MHRNFFENGQVIGVVDKYFEVFQSKNYCTNTAPILPSHETLTNTQVNTYCKYYSILSKHSLVVGMAYGCDSTGAARHGPEERDDRTDRPGGGSHVTAE